MLYTKIWVEVLSIASITYIPVGIGKNQNKTVNTTYVEDHVHIGALAVGGGAEEVPVHVVPASDGVLHLREGIVHAHREGQIQNAAVLQQAPVVEVDELAGAHHGPLLCFIINCII